MSKRKWPVINSIQFEATQSNPCMNSQSEAGQTTQAQFLGEIFLLHTWLGPMCLSSSCMSWSLSLAAYLKRCPLLRARLSRSSIRLLFLGSALLLILWSSNPLPYSIWFSGLLPSPVLVKFTSLHIVFNNAKVHISGTYRVAHLLTNLGWVHFYLGSSPGWWLLL